MQGGQAARLQHGLLWMDAAGVLLLCLLVLPRLLVLLRMLMLL